MPCRIRTNEERAAISRYVNKNPNHRPQVIETYKDCIYELLSATNEDILKNFGHCKAMNASTGPCGYCNIEHFNKWDNRLSYIGRGENYRDALIDMEVVRRTHISESNG